MSTIANVERRKKNCLALNEMNSNTENFARAHFYILYLLHVVVQDMSAFFLIPFSKWLSNLLACPCVQQQLNS